MPTTPNYASREHPAPAVATLLNLAATLQVAWFYLAYVPSALNLPLYEQGLERTPFQQRVLLMLPLRWAHHSVLLNLLAHRLTAMPAWFPTGVHPEGILEALISLASIVSTGLVARSLYNAASPRRLLSAYVYPLTVLMIAATFCFNTMHRLRFVFDLPGMAFFALGLAIIFFRRSPLLFAALFLVATVNRETTLLLLPFYALRQYAAAHADDQTYSQTEAQPDPLAQAAAWKRTADRWRRALRPPTLLLLAALAIAWALWHVFIDRHLSANPTAAGPRLWMNIGTLLWPTSWVQILSTAAFCVPLAILGRNLVRDRTLRVWFWMLPVWFLFMLRFGILIEIRIFGELIPFLACTAALIAEERLLLRITEPPSPPPG